MIKWISFLRGSKRKAEPVDLCFLPGHRFVKGDLITGLGPGRYIVKSVKSEGTHDVLKCAPYHISLLKRIFNFIFGIRG